MASDDTARVAPPITTMFDAFDTGPAAGSLSATTVKASTMPGVRPVIVRLCCGASTPGIAAARYSLVAEPLSFDGGVQDTTTCTSFSVADAGGRR